MSDATETIDAKERFNVYIQTQSTHYSLLDIGEEDLLIIVNGFLSGEGDVLVDGVKYWINNVFEIRVFTYDKSNGLNGEQLLHSARQQGVALQDYVHKSRWYLGPEVLKRLGDDATKKFITGKQGSKASLIKAPPDGHYVDPGRMDDVEKLASGQFDFVKLVQFLKELNVAHSTQSLLSIPMLVRAIIDHVPPIFDKSNFADVCGSHGSRSFKDSMNNLDKSSRKIADSYLHTPIRIRENLPTPVQVNFRHDLDVLLQEIVRIVK